MVDDVLINKAASILCPSLKGQNEVIILSCQHG